MADSTSRPSVLEDVSETQLDELDRQFAQGDHDQWNELTTSYGWSSDDANAVWAWFGNKPVDGESSAPVGDAWTAESNEK